MAKLNLVKLHNPQTGRFIGVDPETRATFDKVGGAVDRWNPRHRTINATLTVSEWVESRLTEGYVRWEKPVAPKAEKKGPRELARIYREAWAAGVAAATATRPTPMHVVERANPLDDTSPIIRRYAPVLDGACGFAWVKFAGNTEFGRWAKKNGKASAHYPTGLSVWISEYNQSVERKAAHAQAMARVLRDNGIVAYGESRLD